MELPESVLVKKQYRKHVRIIGKEKLVVNVRYDDDCGNGHNSFAITADLYEEAKNGRWVWQAGGCMHDEVERFFPHFKKYLKWHLTSSDGPMHYLANTLYHAGDRDCWGGVKGQVRAWKYNICVEMKNVYGTEIVYVFPLGDRQMPTDINKAREMAERIHGWLCPVPWMYYEGKERDFEAARHCAVWPEATDEQLSLPREDLKELLTARLETMMQEFKAAVEELGFIY